MSSIDGSVDDGLSWCQKVANTWNSPSKCSNPGAGSISVPRTPLPPPHSQPWQNTGLRTINTIQGGKGWDLKQCLPRAKYTFDEWIEPLPSVASPAPRGPSSPHCFLLCCLYLHCRSYLWYTVHSDRQLSLCSLCSIPHMLPKGRNNALSYFQDDSKAIMKPVSQTHGRTKQVLLNN